MVNYRLGNGTDVNTPSVQGWTPLHEASEYGRKDIVQMLSSKQPNIAMVHAIDGEETTPLHAATGPGHREVTRPGMTGTRCQCGDVK